MGNGPKIPGTDIEVPGAGSLPPFGDFVTKVDELMNKLDGLATAMGQKVKEGAIEGWENVGDKFTEGVQQALGGLAGTMVAGRQLGLPTTAAGMARFPAEARTAGPQLMTGLSAGVSAAFVSTTDAAEKLGISLGLNNVQMRDFVKGVKASNIPLGALNVSFKDTVEQFADMTKGSKTLQLMMQNQDPVVRKLAGELAAYGAHVKASGADTTDFEKAINTMGKTFGKVTQDPKGFKEELIKVVEQARGLSKTLGMPLGEALKQLGSTAQDVNLLGLGPMQRNITGLTYAAQKLNVDIDELYKMAGGFDTIEGAANRLGQMSAMLGSTSLGVDEMISAEPVDRVKKVLNEIQVAMEEGRFELAEGGQERRFQLKAMAQAAGITAQAMNAIVTSGRDINEVLEEAGNVQGQNATDAANDQIKLQGYSTAQAAALTSFNNAAMGSGESIDKVSAAIENLAKVTQKHIGKEGAIAAMFGNVSAALVPLHLKMTQFAKDGGAMGLVGAMMFGEGNAVEQSIKIMRSVSKQSAEFIKQSEIVIRKFSDFSKLAAAFRKQMPDVTGAKTTEIPAPKVKGPEPAEPGTPPPSPPPRGPRALPTAAAQPSVPAPAKKPPPVVSVPPTAAVQIPTETPRVSAKPPETVAVAQGAAGAANPDTASRFEPQAMAADRRRDLGTSNVDVAGGQTWIATADGKLQGTIQLEIPAPVFRTATIGALSPSRVA